LYPLCRQVNKGESFVDVGFVVIVLVSYQQSRRR
jgi:hypothetical protein